MRPSRRSFLRQAAAASAVVGMAESLAPSSASAQRSGPAVPARNPGYKRIATEEAWAPADLINRFRKMASDRSIDDPGFIALWARLGARSELFDRLTDIGERRLRDMDASGIDVQILSLTSPGVQVFDASTAVAMARDTNDEVAEAIRRHPTRFAGLAAVAPQDPAAAAREMERGVRALGLKGVIINSHTRGEMLDDPKFWDIFEAAEALGVPIYLHPQAPPPAMAMPYVERGLEGALWGFAAEAGLHTLAIVRSGAFDRFPNLRIVVGHLGEGLPFWLFRLDYMNRTARPAVRSGSDRLQKQLSEYFRQNIYVTTSGMPWAPAITFCQTVLGMDRVLYAMDYPYQFEVSEVAATDQVPISRADKRRLYQTNAERVFSL